MSAQNVDSLLHRLFADPEEDHRFIHPDTVNPVPRFQLPAFRYRSGQFDEAGIFSVIDDAVHALALGFAFIQKSDIRSGKSVAFSLHTEVIGVPDIYMFHDFVNCSFHLYLRFLSRAPWIVADFEVLCHTPRIVASYERW